MKILSQKQSDKDTCTIVLNCREFDFYAKTLIEHNGLKADTANLNAQIKVNEDIIRNKEDQLNESVLIQNEKDNIIRTDTIAFKDLSKKYSKEQCKTKRLKQTSLVFVLTTLLLAIIVVLK